MNGHSQAPLLSDSIPKVRRLSCKSRSCTSWVYTHHWYIKVIDFAKINIAQHIVLTSKYSFSACAARQCHSCMYCYVNISTITRDDALDVHVAMFEFDLVILQSVRNGNIYFLTEVIR